MQFTAAQGPGVDAHRSGRRVVATEATIEHRWAAFYDQLITQTPLRSVVAVPLRDELARIGTLDLYCHRSADIARIDLADVNTIAGHITTTVVQERLFPDLRSGPLRKGMPWSNNPSLTAPAYDLATFFFFFFFFFFFLCVCVCVWDS